MAAVVRSRANVSTKTGAPETLMPPFAWPYPLTVALAVVGAIGSAATLFAPQVLRGPAAMNGSARGTALVCLFVATPLLVLSAGAVRMGMSRPVITWLGAVAFLIYNSVLFLFATPFNQLFLLYVATFALAVWTAATLLHEVDVEGFTHRYSASFPARVLAAYIAVVAVLNAAAWLVTVIPAVMSSEPPAFLTGMGLTTNPVYVQDLAFWIPLMAVAAMWMWRRRPWGLLLGGGLMVFAVIEAISIGVDQYMGHAADPASPVVSDSLVPAFGAIALIALVPIYVYMKHVNRD
jgi:hypothetical protein